MICQWLFANSSGTLLMIIGIGPYETHWLSVYSDWPLVNDYWSYGHWPFVKRHEVLVDGYCPNIDGHWPLSILTDLCQWSLSLILYQWSLTPSYQFALGFINRNSGSVNILLEENLISISFAMLKEHLIVS